MSGALRRHAWVGGLLLLAALLGVSAYSAAKSPTERLRRYRESLAEALDVPALPSASQASLPRYPARRALRLPLGDLRIGLLDLLEIQGCELGVLVGQRNSPLGRVMPASERWIYEAQLVDALGTCPIEERGLRGVLTRARTDKYAELPRHRFHALWGGPELRALLTAAPDAAAPDHAFAAASALASLQEVGVAPHAAPAQVRGAFETLHAHRAAGGVLRQLAQATAELEGITEQVRVATQPTPRCRGIARVRQSFERHYVGGIQPRLAVLDHAARPLLAALAALWNDTRGTPGLPAAFERYADRAFDLERSTGLLPGFRAAVRKHAQALTRYAEACGAPLVAGR